MLWQSGWWNDPSGASTSVLATGNNSNEHSVKRSRDQLYFWVSAQHTFLTVRLIRTLWEASKYKLMDCFPSLGEDPFKEHERGSIEYVIDGGSLLHRMSWEKGDKFGQICMMYAEYVVRQYKKPIVMFDGYFLECTGFFTAKDQNDVIFRWLMTRPFQWVVTQLYLRLQLPCSKNRNYVTSLHWNYKQTRHVFDDIFLAFVYHYKQ